GVSPRQPVTVSTIDTLQSQLSDREFWDLVIGLSESGGTFRSDNLISNEETFQHVIPELQRRLPAGGAYLGVGPDQNFTYIPAIEPGIAFVIDIRRDNMLLHLMYKAIIEIADDRADMLSRLFSRARPAALTASSSARELFDQYALAPRSPALFDRNFAAITARLTSVHHFALRRGDLERIDSIYHAFYEEGPDLRYSAPRQGYGGA